ncbi:hypothetical protein N7532_002372 [Penicillium argentinense]|uniref:F-box domain-containing protein n=1 Tax=Penicillium argentinense TaxID=1131581 RepID=A0A9W9KLH0_9EURO|nr:uncharacterized protein N7532_002372 [Penicillium argentinense]KAJ5109727.1 hypothetical protein N7532_002372 [Penicillium argentinense]
MSSLKLPLQQQGHELCEKGDFERAVSAFSEALLKKNADVISILDSRSAAYCALKQYDKARRDAKTMIAQARQDARGYMRGAKALLLDKQPKKALEVYAYGLKVLASGNAGRPQLEKLHKKLEDHILNATKRIDPFSMFPVEIAAFILQHFSFRELSVILMVCKGWARFLGGIRDLWMKIDFSGARQKVKWNAVRAAIRYSRGALTHATIKNMALSSMPQTLDYLSRCSYLEHLELFINHSGNDIFQKFRNCKHLKTIIFSAEIGVTKNEISKFLAHFTKLERIEFWNVRSSILRIRPEWPTFLPNIRSITLATQESVPRFDPNALTLPGLDNNKAGAPTYPNLQELRLDWEPPIYHRWFFFPQTDPFDGPTTGALWPLRRLELNGLTISQNFARILPTTLEYLSLSGGSAMTHHFDEPIPKLTKLHTLKLKDTRWMGPGTLPYLLAYTEAPLRVLHIEEAPRSATDALRIALSDASACNPELFKLAELSLASTQGVNYDFVKWISSHFMDLRVLDVSRTPITGLTIRDFAVAKVTTGQLALPNLDCLIVRGCEFVSSDAVEFGRQRGLQVIT